MHYSPSHLAVGAILSGLAIASPVEIRGQKTFTVAQVPANKAVLQAPALALAKVYAKYQKAGAVAPTSVQKAAAVARQTGTVSATPEYGDESYLCPVVVGGKTLNLDFDTGSADLWVYSSLQPSAQTSNHAFYTPTNSSVLKTGYKWDITYGDGSSASGNVYADKVVVGKVTATAQAVEAATSVSSSFISDTANDGLLGLAFSSVNTVTPVGQTTFFDTVKSTLAQPLFTADLKKGAPGSYDFGFIDSTKYKGAITYVNVNKDNGFWEFNAGGYAIGTGAMVASTYDCIADTGTTLLYLPAAIVKAYYAKIKGSSFSNNQGGYIFPCSSTLPNFAVVIEGVKFTVPGSYLNYGQVSSSQCFGGMQSNAGIGFSILGDIFLKSQFVVFSEVSSTPQLGFAAQ